MASDLIFSYFSLTPVITVTSLTYSKSDQMYTINARGTLPMPICDENGRVAEIGSFQLGYI